MNAVVRSRAKREAINVMNANCMAYFIGEIDLPDQVQLLLLQVAAVVRHSLRSRHTQSNEFVLLGSFVAFKKNPFEMPSSIQF